MKKLNYILIFLLGICLFANQNVYAQTGPACPQVDAGVGLSMSQDTLLPCNDSISLHANIVTNHQTTSYSVSSIPNNVPYPMTGGTPVSANIDDVWSPVITLPFNFCYFGNTYNQCILGSNGQLSFDLTQAGGYDGWPVTVPIPSTSNMPGNTICAAFRDINPGISGNMDYYLTGTAPCRALVVYWNNIPLYSCGTPHSYFELVLYENTNFIDVYIQNSSGTCSWNSGNGIIGIQNSSATVAVTPPGRNCSNWSATNEAWRFTPTGAPSYTFNWYDLAAPTVSIGTSLNLTVTPTTNTNYLGKMILTNCDGSTLTFTDTVQVTVGGTASSLQLTPDDTDICLGQSVTLNAVGNPAGGSYIWIPSGDTTSSITVTPLTTTQYKIEYDDSGCVTKDSMIITIDPIPVANFGASISCEGTPVDFTDSSTVATGTNTGWNWSFGDGGTSTSQNPSNTYSGYGNFNVQLIVSSDSGCKDTVAKNVTVYPPPTANFGAINACFGFPIVFSDSSTADLGSYVTSWYWNFDDLTGTSTQENPSYTYANSGTYNVTLAIKTNINCVDTVTIPVTVYPNPTVDFYSNNKAGCAPWCVDFTDSSTIGLGSISQWIWDFGNASTGNGQNVNNCYQNTGLSVVNYTVTLKAISNEGCISTKTKSNYVSVYPEPIANFTISPNPGNEYKSKIEFTDESQGASVWAWDFGDGTGMSTIENPIYDYSDTGTYVVNLKIKNKWGCKDSTLRTERINPIYSLFIPNAFTPGSSMSKNDYFAPVGHDFIDVDMYIFNRWGNLIYHQHSLGAKWNGVYDGKIVPVGVYVYKIVVRDIFKHEHIYTGAVSVVE